MNTKYLNTPSNWGHYRLAELSYKISVGIATEVSPNITDSGVPLIRNQNIRAGYFDGSDLIFISDKFDKENANKRLRFGDVIIVRTGSNVGQACVVPKEFNDAQTFTTLIVRPKSQLDPNFLSIHLNSLGLREVERLSAGGGKPNLNAGFLKTYNIILPPIQEQRQIATLVNTWDKAISANQMLILQKQILRQGIIQKLLKGKLRLKGFKDSWKYFHLGELFEEREENNRPDLPLLSITLDRGVISQNNSDKKDTSNEDKTLYKRICPGDIGYNTMRMWQGRSALSDLDGIVSPAYTIVTPKKYSDGLFFSYLFKFPVIVNQFYRYSQGLVDDTLNCKYHDFAKIKVLVPSIKEQKAIAEVLVKTDKEILILKSKLELLKQYKMGLVQKLLSGQICFTR